MAQFGFRSNSLTKTPTAKSDSLEVSLRKNEEIEIIRSEAGRETTPNEWQIGRGTYSTRMSRLNHLSSDDLSLTFREYIARTLTSRSQQ